MHDEVVVRHELLFVNQSHLKAYEKVTPGKLREDLEWVPAVYILTMDAELRRKTTCHLNPRNREINWEKIIATDFGSGHRTVILWAFWLWSGHSWGGWEGDDGEMIPQVDTVARWYSMGSQLRLGALVAQAYRWGYKANFDFLA